MIEGEMWFTSSKEGEDEKRMGRRLKVEGEEEKKRRKEKKGRRERKERKRGRRNNCGFQILCVQGCSRLH